MDDVKQWLQALITLPLPIVSITFSGSRSLHVLFRLEAATHEEWRGYVDQIKPALALIGADIQALTNHLVMPRLPGCYRTVNGQEKLQELLYFNPRPTLRPLLYATPLRNVEQDWTTRAAEIVARPDEWPLPLIQQAAAACTTYGLNAALQSLTPLLPPKNDLPPRTYSQITKFANQRLRRGSSTIFGRAGATRPHPCRRRPYAGRKDQSCHALQNGTTTPQWCERVAIALQRANAPIYNLAGSPVYITDDGKTVYLNPNNFISAAEKYICPCAFRSKDDSTLVYQPMKEPLAKLTLSSMEFLTAIPELIKIHDQITPAMLPNGTYHLNQRGYDPESKIYTLKTAVDYDTEMPLEQALLIWRNWHKEFPFLDWSSSDLQERATSATSRSFAVHTCACVALYASAMLPLSSPRLGYVYTSNSQRSGKSLLADLATGITYNNNAKHPWYYDDEKLQGVLNTILNTRAPYVYFDNLRGKLQSTCLESFISSVSQDIRPFHTQSLVTKQNCATVFITGNSLEWNTDLASRLLICDLNLTESNPQDRTVQRVIDLETIQDSGNRAELLACLHAFVRNWIEQKRPMPDKTRAGFQRTSSIIAGIVSLLGIGDPFGERPDEIYGGGDQNLQDMRDLVQTAAARLKPGETYGEIKWDEIIEICIERNSFESLIDARTEYVTETDETGHESKIPRYKLTQASNKRFSFLLNSTYGGKTFKLNDGRTVKWDSRGKKRSKKYTFQIS